MWLFCLIIDKMGLCCFVLLEVLLAPEIVVQLVCYDGYVSAIS